MIKVIVWGYRKSGMSLGDFRRWAQEEHGPIAIKTPGIRTYTQHVAREDGSPEPREFDWLTVFSFDSLESCEAAFASPESQAGYTDAANGIELDTIRSVVVEEAFSWP